MKVQTEVLGGLPMPSVERKTPTLSRIDSDQEGSQGTAQADWELTHTRFA